jgi:diguanylate cyclase (GGDEF)-like protein/PAS domain S-box-containing protein
LVSHRDASQVNRCVQELARAGFPVDPYVVPDPAQLTDHPELHTLDVAICEYSGDLAQKDLPVNFIAKVSKDVPLILLVDTGSRENTTDLISQGAADCVASESFSELMVAVGRVLRERALRQERDRAEQDLRRLQAHYQALAGNQTYGICRCDPSGAFLDVNQALVSMLGYSSKEELFAINFTASIFADPAKLAQLLGRSVDDELGETPQLELDWLRKNGTSLKVCLSAQEVISDVGQLEAYEVIVEDITKQRELEDHLRRAAASDPLTGLANYRHLIDALDREIRRSNRTGREFALFLFDMDGLKQLNDSYGHVTGSQALCRTADALTLYCRDIDTAARFGGDEFALLLPETGLEAAHCVARRISGSIAEDGNGPPISVSVGASVYPSAGETVEALVSAADEAMYAMKRQKKLTATVG